MFRAARNIAALSALALLGLTQTANAQTFFPNNATINYGLIGSAVVGYANDTDRISKTNPTSPTVNITSGGNIHGYYSYLFVYNNSVVNIRDGSISDIVYAMNSSRISISGGSLGDNLDASDNSVINISGGNIIGGVIAGNNSAVNIRGGSVGNNCYIDDSGTINFFGLGLKAIFTDPNAYNGFSQYTLFGTRNDGTSIDGEIMYVHISIGAHFTLNTDSKSRNVHPHVE